MSLKTAQQQGYLLTEAEQRKLEKLILEEYKAANKAIQARLDKLAAQMADVDIADRYSWYIQYDRNIKLQKDLKKIYTNYDLSAMSLTKQSGNIGMANNYYRQYYLLNFQTPLKTAVLNPSLLNYAVTGDIKSWQALSSASKAKYGNPAVWSPNGTLKNLFQKNRVDTLRKIQLQINSGLMAGTSYREISKNVSNVIGTVSKGKASGQMANALRITRTEGNRLMNAGSLATSVEAEEQGIKMVKAWDATLDSGTRPAHAEADGQQKPVKEPFIVDGEELMYPGDSAGSEGNIINCFTGGNIVSPHNILKAYKRAYKGDIVNIITESGINLRVTPNHPILTPQGWVEAKLLDIGCDLLTMPTIDISGNFNHDINNKPTQFSKLFDFLSLRGECHRVDRSSYLDFHGDSSTSNSNIDIILIDSKLMNRVYIFFFEKFNEFKFSCSNILHRFLSSLSGLIKTFFSSFRTAQRFISMLRKILFFFFRQRSHSNIHSIASIPNRNRVLSKKSINNLPRDVVLFSKSFNRSPGVISIDKILSINTSNSNTHVYNLQTKNSMYIVAGIQDSGNGVIAHNCRCTVTDLVEGQNPQLRRARDPVTGKNKVINYQTYPEWAAENNLTHNKYGQAVLK